jgi:hypothetical protein
MLIVVQATGSQGSSRRVLEAVATASVLHLVNSVNGEHDRVDLTAETCFHWRRFISRIRLGGGDSDLFTI